MTAIATRVRGLALVEVLGLTAAPAAAGMTTRGTMQAGGQVSAEFERVSTLITTTGVRVNVAPGFGYFVLDGLELRLNVGLDLPIGGLYGNSSKTTWVDVGARYFLDVGHGLYPYVGLASGPSFTLFGGGDTSTTLAVSVPAGLLVALSDAVALDLGVRVEYARVVKNGTGRTLKIPVGLLGVQAFFD